MIFDPPQTPLWTSAPMKSNHGNAKPQAAPPGAPPMALHDYLQQLNNPAMIISQQVKQSLTLSRGDPMKSPQAQLVIILLERNLSGDRGCIICVKVWLAPGKLGNWIHKTHCNLAERPSDRTLNDLRTDLLPWHYKTVTQTVTLRKTTDLTPTMPLYPLKMRDYVILQP